MDIIKYRHLKLDFSVDIIKYEHLKLGLSEDYGYPFSIDFGISDYDGSEYFMYKDMDALFFLGNDVLTEYFNRGAYPRSQYRMVLV